MAENKRLIRQRKTNEILGAMILGFFFAVIVMKPYKGTKISPPQPVKQTIEVKAEEVTPTPTKSLESIKSDPISYIRFRGEELGLSNNVIKTMIRISRAESTHDPKAKNKSSTASGLFQILIGTWENKHYQCEGNRYSIVDNTDCAYKIYTVQTKLYEKKGKVYNFSDWNESKYTKNGWGL